MRVSYKTAEVDHKQISAHRLIDILLKHGFEFIRVREGHLQVPSYHEIHTLWPGIKCCKNGQLIYLSRQNGHRSTEIRVPYKGQISSSSINALETHLGIFIT